MFPNEQDFIGGISRDRVVFILTALINAILLMYSCSIGAVIISELLRRKLQQKLSAFVVC